MIRTEINAHSENEQREIERKLKETGYGKTSDSMWTKIYRKVNLEIVLNREW